jgi:hypothetical protein
MKKVKKVPSKINLNKLKPRNPIFRKLATNPSKSGPHKDKKKELNKKACRKKSVKEEISK